MLPGWYVVSLSDDCHRVYLDGRQVYGRLAETIRSGLLRLGLRQGWIEVKDGAVRVTGERIEQSRT